ncbi:hypothetical protein [Azotobacter beijerinckii]|uniref:Uncharacterized protein n=1 Tax=Azotobacter beijerinckii TaxID=170623 RepID=A0A1I4J5I2_9GAMM|nr:hypothetical protein [Azotobacter beijerinckii]SFB65120.1 hypothetical protein SAMN04244571_04769 [Azotobacter beijerinckii]SFL61852.1 hypothetical protein SAMN04244574_04768 [Azotobacter beijerinckii]
MGYYNGTANDLTALRQALIDACTGEGWAWDSINSVLSNGTMFANLAITANGITLLGKTGVTSGAAPSAVRIGKLFNRSGYPTYDIMFPAAYEVFLFDREVYLVVKYDVDRYQWMAFGQSTVSGLPGTGMWVGASAGASVVDGTWSAVGPIAITGNGGPGGNNNKISGALFWATDDMQSGALRNFFVHSNLDGLGWYTGGAANTSSGPSIETLDPLVGLLPNSWNSEAVLLPMRSYKVRGTYRISLIADIEHARYTRVDNYAPGEIIMIGSDRWKVFPWHRKNTSVRNGSSSSVGIDHTGTFGWAIRYEGL